MTLMSVVAAVAPCTGKINKNGLSVFERGENLLQIEFSQTKTFLKWAWHLRVQPVLTF